MISFVRGILCEVTENTVVIDVCGVGYELLVTQGVFKNVSRIGEEVKLPTYLQVKEDGVCLFGFSDKDELELFKLLITVNGVGPKGALAILSTLGPDDLRFAIMSEDAKTISRTPGIGTKTASKMIIELKDKMDLADAFEKKLSKTVGAEDKNGNKESKLDARAKREAVEALVALGFSQTEASRAVGSVVITEDMEADDILKAALKYM